MTFHSGRVLGQLQALERHVADSAKFLDTHQDYQAWKDRERVARWVAERNRLITAVARTTSRIKSQVITTDGLGPRLDFVAELVLRALRMVLLAELALLQQLAGRHVDRLSHVHCQPRYVDDLGTFLRVELERITRTWIEYRDRPQRLAFRFALAAATQALRRLGKAPELERFLCANTRDASPALVAICTRMRAVFELRIEIQPEHPLLRYATRNVVDGDRSTAATALPAPDSAHGSAVRDDDAPNHAAPENT